MITPKVRNENIIVQELLDETLLYDMKVDKVYCLNHSLSAVYHACDGKKSLPELQTIVSEKLQTSITNEFILLSLKQLDEKDLLAESDKLNEQINLAGMSRRQLVKNAGLATIIALPLISSLVAPQGVNAISSCVNPNPCSPFSTPLVQGNCCPGFLCVYNGSATEGTCSPVTPPPIAP